MNSISSHSDNSNSPSKLSRFFSRFSSTSREKSSDTVSTSSPTSEKAIKEREVEHPTQPTANLLSRIGSTFLSFVLSALSMAKSLFSRSATVSPNGEPMVKSSFSQGDPFLQDTTVHSDISSSSSNRIVTSEDPTPITSTIPSPGQERGNTSPGTTSSTLSSTSSPPIQESSSETPREEPIPQEIKLDTPPRSTSSQSSKIDLPNETKASSDSIASRYSVPNNYTLTDSNKYRETFALTGGYYRQQKEKPPESYSKLPPQEISEQKHLTEIAILNNNIWIQRKKALIKDHQNDLNKLKDIPEDQRSPTTKKAIEDLESSIRINQKYFVDDNEQEIEKLQNERLILLNEFQSDKKLDKDLKVQRLEVLKKEQQGQITDERKNIEAMKRNLEKEKKSPLSVDISELENSIKYHENKLKDMEIEFDKVDIEQMELEYKIMEEKNTTAKTSESKTNSDDNTLKIDEKATPGDAIGSETVEFSPTTETSPSDQTAVSSGSTESIPEDGSNLEQGSVTESPPSSNVESSNVTGPAIGSQSSEAASTNTEVSEEKAKPESADKASE